MTNSYEKSMNMPRLHFIRAVDPRNTGDFNCSPIQYFEDSFKDYVCFQHCISERIDWNAIKPHDWIILGGGGLFEITESCQQNINHLLARTSGRVISWACGHNKHVGDNDVQTEIEYKKFALFTVRDYGYMSVCGELERYLPCVSCMNPAFDANFNKPILRNIGIIEHHVFPINMHGYDKITNAIMIKQILEFIGTSEIIITNTYHAVYWATLLNKKVILYGKFSNKFDYFKYKPVEYSGDLQGDILKARTYSNALEESRDLNTAFCLEVLNMLKDKQRNSEMQQFRLFPFDKVPKGSKIVIPVFPKERRNLKNAIAVYKYFLINSIRNKKIGIKGGGRHTEAILEIVKNRDSIKIIFDKNPIQSKICQIPIVSDDEISNFQIDAVVISSFKYRSEMKKDLLELREKFNLEFEIIDVYESVQEIGYVYDREFYEI